MNGGNLIFLLLLSGAVLWMFSMHRGGHSHGGMGGGCGGGHSHGSDPQDEAAPDTSHEREQTLLLGPPGSQRGAPAPAPAPAPAHAPRRRGC